MMKAMLSRDEPSDRIKATSRAPFWRVETDRLSLIKSMQCSPSDLVWDHERGSSTQKMTKFESLWSVLQGSFRDREAVHALLRRFQANNFVIADLNDIGLANGCLPLNALANHACDSSATVVFNLVPMEPPSAKLYASRNVPTSDEITIQYVDKILSPKIRVQRLGELYGFPCDVDCSRCYQPSNRKVSLDLSRYWYFHSDISPVVNGGTHRSTIILAITKNRLVNSEFYRYLNGVYDQMISGELKFAQSECSAIANALLSYRSVFPSVFDPIKMTSVLELVAHQGLSGVCLRNTMSFIIGRVILFIQSHVYPSDHDIPIRHPVMITQAISVADFGRLALQEWSKTQNDLKSIIINLYQACHRGLDSLGGEMGPYCSYSIHCSEAILMIIGSNT
eukprot:GHVH01007081.1.p1 GENE.GHVH01007081.1~~GHVH01007081.1.p1  ORF type:complete len:394 (+),score=37.10 GHVH01007081.1:437-1618(+)